jgi:thymidine kinase
MNFLSVRNTIDIIFGPMFSGKTSELVNRLNIFTVAGYKVLYINSSFDTRGETFSTHNSSITNMHTDIKQIKTKTRELLEGLQLQREAKTLVRELP